MMCASFHDVRSMTSPTLYARVRSPLVLPGTAPARLPPALTEILHRARHSLNPPKITDTDSPSNCSGMAPETYARWLEGRACGLSSRVDLAVGAEWTRGAGAEQL